MESPGSVSPSAAQLICLVIPTVNRPQYLKRLLNYYSQLKFPALIFIADSSRAPNDRENQRIVASYDGHLRLQYEAFDPTIRFLVKISKSLSIVTADYAAICADDDFLIPVGLDACLDFLQNHDQYAAAQGTTSIFRVVQSNHDPKSWSFNVLRKYFPKRSLAEEQPIDRLLKHLSSYRPTFYAIHRRAYLLTNLQKTARYSQDARFRELLSSCLTVVQGKVKRLDVPFDVRESHGGQKSRDVYWQNLLASGDFREQYEAFRECLVLELGRIAGESPQQASIAVDRAARTYFSNVFGVFHPEIHFLYNAKSRLIYSFRQRLRHAVREIPILGPAAVKVNRDIRMRKVKQASVSPLPDFDLDLTLIKQLVLQYAESSYNDVRD